ncbi:hypothetical protein RCL_jg29208.t1 [Rhizophagus clarus]|uniref:Uncharacterized protein n=1 Tax=Rhizophagus clarus TaxID=94130 RepID=A0A8H3MA77_9GLOM|nr:hypothetical protein RCL_jg29208.t1 [Rhizophagus clarus]
MVKNEYLTLNKLKVLQIIPKKAKKINEHQKDDSLFATGYNLEQGSRKAAEQFEDKGNPWVITNFKRKNRTKAEEKINIEKKKTGNKSLVIAKCTEDASYFPIGMGVRLDPIPRKSKRVWTCMEHYVNAKIIKDLHSVDGWHLCHENNSK